MDAAWITLGIVILVVTFVDIFLAVLNYNEPGIIINRLVRLQWIALRSITRRVPRRWRPVVLRQVTGVLLLSTILWWIGGVVLGFTLIYLGLIGLGAFQLSKGVDSDFVGALYLSVGQFATVGADNISPAGGWVNLVPVAEALLSVVLLSFIITFLSNIYGVIQFLRSLCADFFSAGPGVGDPVDALRPYFPNGSPRDLDRHLNELVDDFNLYCDSLRQDHAAYHFQSGEDQFALPFALYMTSGVTGALRWGLPTGSVAALSPSLPRLIEVFDDFRVLRYRTMRWPAPVVPAAVPIERFRSDAAAFDAGSTRSSMDPWVQRFLTLNAEMAAIVSPAGATVQSPADTYARYTHWLAFAYPAQHFVMRVSTDLDYQPIYRGVAAAPADPESLTRPTDAGTPAVAAARPIARPTGRPTGTIAWLRRRHLLLDPGFTRLSAALRTLGAVVIAVVAAAVGSVALQVDPIPAGVFAALIAVFSMPTTSGWGSGVRRGTGLLALVPVAIGIAGGALVPRDRVTAVVILALVAAFAVWLGRFGPRWAMWGQVGFLAYYFSLLLAVTAAELVAALVAGGIGVVSSWATNLVPRSRPDREVQTGIRVVAERTSIFLDAATDALSGGGGRTTRVLRAESAALRTSVTSLTTVLDPDADTDVSSERILRRRVQAFDVQLAAENLVRALPGDDDVTVSVAERSILAGELTSLGLRIARLRHGDAAGAGTVSDRAAGAQLSTRGRRVHDAVDGLADAIAALLSPPARDAARPAALEASAEQRPAASDRPAHPSAGDRAAARAIDRRAVQAGLATGLALFLASFVSSTHQYWAAMPAYQALSGSDGERLTRTIQRLVGAVAGAALAFGVALATGHDGLVASIVVVVSVFFMAYLRAVASGWTAFWQTVLLATLYDLLARLDAEAIHVRVLETLIGALVAILVAAVILPTRTRARALSAMAALVSTAAGIVHTTLQALADPASAPEVTRSRTIADAESALQRELDDLLGSAGPLRRDPGALQRSGIESQLTSLMALAFHVRTLVHAAGESRAADHGSDAARWQRLDAVTRDNFTSALAVLGHRLPARIHDLSDVASDGDAPQTGSIAAVERINETLLTFMGAVQPGSADASSNSGGNVGDPASRLPG